MDGKTASACGPLVKWPKTPASHAGNTGSNPVRVTIAGFRKAVGVYGSEVPPVPIPNTVVKFTRADDTWRATAREDRTTPTHMSHRIILLNSVGRASVAS